MKIVGNLSFHTLGDGQLENAIIERLASDPTPAAGRIYYNTTANEYRYHDGTVWKAFANGGGTGAIQTELNNVEATLGTLVNTDGTTNVAAVLTNTVFGGATDLTTALQNMAAYATGKDQLAELLDVNVSSLALNDFLVYDTGTSKWINQTTTDVKTALNLVIGTDVQAHDAGLDALATGGTGLVSMNGDTVAFRTLVESTGAVGLIITNGTGVSGNPSIAIDAGLNSIAGLTTAADKMIYTTALDTYAVTDLSSYARSNIINQTSEANLKASLNLEIGVDVQAFDQTLTGLSALSSTGIVVETAADVFTNRSLVQPSAGITIANPAGIAGNPTFALANDLAAYEGLTTYGYVVRDTDGTAVTRTLQGAVGNIAISNGDGVATDTTIDLATVTDAGGGSFLKLSRDTYGRVTGTSAVVAGDITGLVDSTYVNASGDTMTGNLVMSGGSTQVRNPNAPVVANDLTNKAYVDALIVSGTVWKSPVIDPDIQDVVAAIPSPAGSVDDTFTYIKFGGTQNETWGGLTNVVDGDVVQFIVTVAPSTGTWSRIQNLAGGERMIIAAEHGTIGANLYGIGFRKNDLIAYVSGNENLFASYTTPEDAGYQVINFVGPKTSGTATTLTNGATSYDLNVSIGGTPHNVTVLGSAAQTFGTLASALTTALNAAHTGASCVLEPEGHFHIFSGDGSKVIVSEGTGSDPLLAGLTTDFDSANIRSNILAGIGNGDTLLVNDPDSYHYSHTYVYTEGINSWTEIAGPGAVGAGTGLVYSGTVLNINMGAGIVELPTDEVGIDLYDSVTGAIILTTDSTSRSAAAGSKLHLLIPAGAGLTQDATGLYIPADGVTNTMLLNEGVATNGDSGSGTLNLGATLTINGTATQGIVTSVTGSTFTITASNASNSQKGVAKFNTASFDVTAGDVTIKTAGVSNGQLANSSFTVTDLTTPQGIDLGGTLTVGATSGTGVSINTTTTDKITIAGIDATTSSKGVASFNSASFAVSSGDVTIKSGGVSNAQLQNSVITINGDTGTDTVALGETLTVDGNAAQGVSVDMTTNTLSITVADAAADGTTKGVAAFNSSHFSDSAGVISLAASTADLSNVTGDATAVGQVMVAGTTPFNYTPRQIQYVYSGSAATTHTVTHNLGQKYCVVTVIDGSDEQIIPQSVTFNSTTQLTVVFNTSIACKVSVMGVAGV